MNECKIVEDLLPLYAEELVSQESGAFIREHCAGCDRCRRLLERSKEVIPMKNDTPNYKKALKRDRTQSILLGIALTILFFSILATIFVAGWIPQKLDTDVPILLESPDGVHSIYAEPYTSRFGINQGLRTTWTRGEFSGNEGTREGWMEILDAQWSPDGTDVLLTVRMKSGETRMEIWYHDYGEYGDRSGIFPLMNKDGWDYDDLSAECSKLLTREGKLPDGWTSIDYDFVEWGDDSESARFRWKTDNGNEGTTHFGFDFAEHKIWIIE